MIAPEPEYVEARRVLLDALEALAPHSAGLVVAGAQAVYLRVGAGSLAVAPYTTDGDLALDPTSLSPSPAIEAAMGAAGFQLSMVGDHVEPGVWLRDATINGQPVVIPVDLIVPEGFSPPGGRRAARLGLHGNRSARRAVGLEAALVDNSLVMISALDPEDQRSLSARVAGVPALLVAKAHKLHDRLPSGRADRINDKDAADVFRMMAATSASTVAVTLASLAKHPVAGPPTQAALGYLDELFGRRGRPGIELAARSLGVAIPQVRVETVSTAYMAALLGVVGDTHSENHVDG